MLLRRNGDRVLAIGQLSHAWLSGQLARAWGNQRFADPIAREEVALGAEQHDIGWVQFDSRPGLSKKTGLPRSFLETSAEEHLAIWRAAPDHLISVSEHAALAVSLHGSALSELRLRGGSGSETLLMAHITDERERQARLRSRLGLSEEETRSIQRLMWAWDGLSLALCQGWNPFTVREVPLTAGGIGELELQSVDTGFASVEPWPFSVPSLEVRCEGRKLAESYENEDEMRRDFQEAERVTLVFSLVASSS